jgi:hypothetical protein
MAESMSTEELAAEDRDRLLAGSIRRKVYGEPTSVCLGEVPIVTLGGSVGFGDSGHPGTQQPL